MRNLPGKNRVPSDRVFYDDYAKAVSEGTAILGYAYGDTIILLKSQRLPNHNVNVSGNDDVRGRLGGRRFDIPTGIQPQPQPDNNSFGRPEENDLPGKTYQIPAITDFISGNAQIQGPGRILSNKPTIFISTKIMEDLEITIVPEEDLLQYKNKKYYIINSYPRMNFLNSTAEMAYEIEETK